MKIILCENEKQVKKQDITPMIVDTVFAICKEDKNFRSGGNVKTINHKLEEAKGKLETQLELINKSEDVKQTLLEKIKALDDDSFKIKVQVLESLGSEL